MSAEAQFETATAEAIRECKERSYNPTYFIRMIQSEGSALAAAKKLLSTGQRWQDGLTRLWEMNALNLSIENAALDPRWEDLFTDTERATARERLASLGVQA